jgi:hypothetical protein
MPSACAVGSVVGALLTSVLAIRRSTTAFRRRSIGKQLHGIVFTILWTRSTFVILIVKALVGLRPAQEEVEASTSPSMAKWCREALVTPAVLRGPPSVYAIPNGTAAHFSGIALESRRDAPERCHA